MYKVLIVDDEQIVLDSIEYIILKREDNISVCGLASNGREAIELMKVQHPDIVIIDIQMPGITGIDAIKEMKRIYPRTRFVIISAYEHFEFAKQAVQLGVKEYLLKPINRGKLNLILNQLVLELDQEHVQKECDIETIEKLQNMIPFMENGFIYSVILNNDCSMDMKQYLRLMEINCECGFMIVFQFQSFANQKTDLILESIQGHEKYPQIREMIKYKCHAIVGPLMVNKIITFVAKKNIINNYDTRIESISLAKCIQSKIKERLNIDCQIGIGSITAVSELYYSYAQAIKSLMLSSTLSITHIADLYGDQEQSSEVLNIQSQLIESLAGGQLYRALKQFDKLFPMICDKNDKLFELVVLIFRIAHAEGVEEDDMINYTNYLREIGRIEDTNELNLWISTRMVRIANKIQSDKAKKCGFIVENTKAVLINQYYREITLESVARTQNISPQYLSKIFKEEIGCTFIEFLTDIRISQAQKIMSSSNKSVKEICFEVGYSDPNYFSRLFRKKTGCMPTEYMNNTKNRENYSS